MRTCTTKAEAPGATIRGWTFTASRITRHPIRASVMRALRCAEAALRLSAHPLRSQRWAPPLIRRLPIHVACRWVPVLAPLSSIPSPSPGLSHAIPCGAVPPDRLAPSPRPSPGRPSRRLPAAAPPLGVLLAVAVLFAAPLLPGVGSAAQADVLVSNLGQPDEAHSFLAVDRVGAQKFTTGSNALGYTLSEVVAKLKVVGSDSIPVVSIYSDSSGTPGTSLYTLTSPSSITAGDMEFTAPANATLSKETDYFVVFENTNQGGRGSDAYRVSLSGSKSEDAGAARGWSIHDKHHNMNSSSGWISLAWVLQIAIRGTAPVWPVTVAGKDSTIRVDWDPFENANKYRVQWRSEDQFYSTTERSHTAGGDDRGHRIYNLEVGVKHFVRITALQDQNGTVTELGVSEEIEHVTHGYFDAFVDPAVGDARALEVVWESVPGAGYVIEWGASTDDCKAVYDVRSLANHDSVVGEDTLDYLITGLQPDTEYDVRVTPYTDYGSPSDPDGLSWTECWKPTHTEITTVTVKAVDGSATELAVSWTLGTFANAYSIKKFLVQWKSGDGDYTEANTKTVEDGTSKSTTIDNLTTGTEYTVRVITQVPVVPNHPRLLDGDMAEGKGTPGGASGTSGGEPAAAPGKPTITVYHDPNGSADAVRRYSEAVALLKAKGRSYTVRTVTGTAEVERLAGLSATVMPRFFLGDPKATDWGPSQPGVNNGGLRWLRSLL